ncbi:MAG: hypothetical protein JST93_11495 [Acidobacteria bacterium]|nr:hypothetical protein [Acidobacteriota bacterium]
MIRKRLTAIPWVFAVLLHGEVPVVVEIVNAASGRAPCSGCPFASGSLARIRGQNLSRVSLSAETTPLPRDLGGTSVLIDGDAAPLFSVSVGEILFQVPNSPRGITENRMLRVRSPDGLSAPHAIVLDRWGPMGVFTSDGKECGPPLLFNLVSRDGRTEYVRNSPSASVPRMGFITLFMTGLTLEGLPEQWPVVGVPTEAAAQRSTPIEAHVGGRAYPLGFPRYAGRVPGLVGVDQVNIEVSGGAPEGCNLPVRLSRGSGTPALSDFPLSIGSGGQCEEPPALGKVVWKKTVTSSAEGVSARETLDVAIARSPFPPDTIPWVRYPDNSQPGIPAVPFYYVPPPRPRCTEDVFTQHLPVERVEATAQDRRPVVRRLEELRNGLGYREVELPAGSIVPGRFELGIEDPVLGRARSEIRIPEPIRITTDLRPGTRFLSGPPNFISLLNLRWEGGDPDSWVVVVVHRSVGFEGDQVIAEEVNSVRARASQGRIDVRILAVPARRTFEVEVWNYREGYSGERMPLAGLFAPLDHGWRYVFRFQGLLTD